MINASKKMNHSKLVSHRKFAAHATGALVGSRTPADTCRRKEPVVHAVYIFVTFLREISQSTACFLVYKMTKRGFCGGAFAKPQTAKSVPGNKTWVCAATGQQNVIRPLSLLASTPRSCQSTLRDSWRISQAQGKHTFCIPLFLC